GPLRSPPGPPLVLKSGGRVRTPSVCLYPPEFGHQWEACTLLDRFSGMPRPDVRSPHPPLSEMRARSGGTIPGSRQFLAGNASRPIPFPRTLATQLCEPRSSLRIDCLNLSWPDWFPTDNSTSNRSRSFVCQGCTFAEHESGCRYAVVEERCSCCPAFCLGREVFSGAKLAMRGIEAPLSQAKRSKRRRGWW